MAAKKATVPPPYGERLARARAAMTRLKLDGYLIVNRTDQYWLTGFTGEVGHTLVTQRGVTLLTDGRFDETADMEAPWARKVVRKVRTPEPTIREIRREKIARLGYEPDDLNVRVFSALSKDAKPTRLVASSALIRDLRILKDAAEVAAIREAIAIAQRGFERLREWLKPGQTEREVAARLIYEMQTLGAMSAAFDPIVASGTTGSLPHYTPSSRKISTTEALLIDWGARSERWYVSDLTRTIWLGSIAPDIRKAYEVVKRAHDAAIAAVRAGVQAVAVDRAAREIIRKAGYGKNFSHGLGHGIGLDVHEAPRIALKSKDTLKPGMVFTIEPGVYLPGVGGVRIESNVWISERGPEVLTSTPY